MFATGRLAYGTDARDSVISAELVFIGHANILTVEVLCGGLQSNVAFTTGVVGRQITVETSPLQCAGLNRHEAEEEEALRERISDPLGPEFSRWASRGARRSVNRGIGGVEY